VPRSNLLISNSDFSCLILFLPEIGLGFQNLEA
jgi:hypothetical protein